MTTPKPQSTANVFYPCSQKSLPPFRITPFQAAPSSRKPHSKKTHKKQPSTLPKRQKSRIMRRFPFPVQPCIGSLKSPCL
ncbi:hypothetical protein GCWU000324_02367 [Kingella oralis ATCC 51147]|uniref:Uncharacterized protein n=1 Tax=Kingella oralis ATCC 51147 TaxID=629741 RepID=C4GJZ3_9NEIS|nr:hypothetical protein GCWU000324_02367 [Kingella oralis ATCC 51147]